MAKTRAGKCSVCGEPSVPEYRPFCSKRCADIDLGRWLKGGYVIAAGNSDADEYGEEPIEPERENTRTAK